jgi:hypothetical protein
MHEYLSSISVAVFAFNLKNIIIRRDTMDIKTTSSKNISLPLQIVWMQFAPAVPCYSSPGRWVTCGGGSMSARMASFCQVIKECIYYVCGKGMPSSCSSVLSTGCQGAVCCPRRLVVQLEIKECGRHPTRPGASFTGGSWVVVASRGLANWLW